MTTPNRPRGFEDQLLSELKTYVSERNQNMTNTEGTPAKTSRFGRAAKFSLAGGVGAVALGIGAIVAMPALTASTAYAVEPSGDGEVTIKLYNTEDAKGLEDTLAHHGIKAKVDYPGKGMLCDTDRLTEVDDANLETYFSPEIEEGDEEGNLMQATVNVDDFPVDGDRTLVIEVGEGYFEGESDTFFSTIVAEGEVGECKEVKGELPDDDSDNDATEEGEADTDGNGPNGGDKDDDGSKDKN